MPNDKEFELDDLESFSFDDLSLDETPPAEKPAAGEDPLGVWVKSAPEDLEASGSAASPSTPPGAPAASEELAEEDFLSSEELANLDDSFEFVTVEEPLEGESPVEAEPALQDEVAFLDTPEAIEAEKNAGPGDEAPSFDEISLDDFVSFDDVPSEEGSAPESPLQSSEVAPGDDELNEEFLDIDIDIEDDINDEDLEVVEGAQPKKDTSFSSSDSFESQEVDLSEFGDFEEVSPLEAGPLGEGEDLPEVKDLPEISALEEEALLSDEDGFFEEEILDEPVAGVQDEGLVSLDLEPDDQTDLDHIMALEEDLTSGIREPQGPAPEAQVGSDLAALILSKIEQELSSIKQEISELKKEVTHLRVAPAPVEAAPEAVAEPFPAPESAVAEPEPKSHGFFDEEDDETIALTGDELDNILSTAEISEGEEPGVNLDEDLLSLDAEGNLVSPEQPTSFELPGEALEEEPPVVGADELHVTDEEFLAGTALADELPEGIPDSIELEESLPLGLDADETEDLLADSGLEFEVEPLPEGLLDSGGDTLELPSDEDLDLDLELAEAGTLAPELIEEEVPFTEELSLESLEAEPEPELAEEAGWSPAAAEPLPTPPPVTTPSAGSAPTEGSGLSPGLKDELRAVLSYMDKLLASLPDDKIQEFAESEHFEVYKRLFEELGLIE